MLSDGVPHADLPSMTGGDQLTPDKEERIDRHAQTEHTYSNTGTDNKHEAIEKYSHPTSSFLSKRLSESIDEVIPAKKTSI